MDLFFLPSDSAFVKTHTIALFKKHSSKKLTNSASKAKVATFAFSLHETNCLVKKELAKNLVRLLFVKTRSIQKEFGQLPA